MAYRNIPQVINNYLHLSEQSESAAPVEVGSHIWYNWLADITNRSFSFKSPAGTFTARHEQQRNSWYWYAYHKHMGKMHKAYLGKPAEISFEHLRSIAQILSRQVHSTTQTDRKPTKTADQLTAHTTAYQVHVQDWITTLQLQATEFTLNSEAAMNMQTIQPSKHDMYENRQPAFLEKMLLLRSLILQTRNEFPGALSLLTQILTIEDQQARLEVADQGPLHTLLEQLRSIDTETQSTAPTLKEEQRISMPVGVTGTGTSNTNTNKDPMACFTDREREVVQRLLQGLPNRSIAEQLIISEGTVKKHVANICGKLGVKTRTQAIAIIFSWLQEQPQ